MTKLIAALSTAALALSLAGPAAAQVAGVYSGTAADGSGLSFTVGTDSNTNLPAIISASISFTAACKGTTTPLQNGWGYNPNADISGRKVTYNYDFDYLSNAVSLTFSADGQTATGTIASISPTLTPVGPKPTKALFCSSKKQSLSLTLQPATAKVTPQPRAVLY
jgi:hypothetical protein